jgi:hypothetical protein
MYRITVSAFFLAPSCMICAVLYLFVALSIAALTRVL